jgi:lysophospholipase L1-like esterase
MRPSLPLLLSLFFINCASARADSSPQRFEKHIQAFEAADKTTPPPQGAILLLGDSQFDRWKTVDQDMPGYTIINRGVGGFEISDMVYYADRLVRPYRARLIVVNAGGNDVHDKKSPDAVLAELKSFVTEARAVQPGVPMLVSGLSPGPGRFAEAPQRIVTNKLLKDYCAATPGLTFFNMWEPMLTPAGQPRPELWVADGIHSNHAGYLIRAGIILPLLGKPDKAVAN